MVFHIGFRNGSGVVTGGGFRAHDSNVDEDRTAVCLGDGHHLALVQVDLSAVAFKRNLTQEFKFLRWGGSHDAQRVAADYVEVRSVRLDYVRFVDALLLDRRLGESVVRRLGV